MKIKKYKIIIVALLLSSTYTFSQKDKTGNNPELNVTYKIGISDYHTEEMLKAKGKGDLIELYQARFNALLQMIPQLGFTFKPGQTLRSLGIPENSDNKDANKKFNDMKSDFISTGLEYQAAMLPFSDSSNIIKAILFYEEIFKQIEVGMQQQ